MSDLPHKLRREARESMTAAIDLMTPAAAYQLGYVSGLQEAAQRMLNEELTTKMVRMTPATGAWAESEPST